ncbi:MAG: universal stress protein [Desulfobacter sp.]|nr:MAG: universal stress protein [Desulfobacter sp.]
MYKKILFGTCLTDYCSKIFNHALTLAQENDARLMIYYGLGKLNLNQEDTVQAIKAAEVQATEAYVGRMAAKGFDNYAINVSDGDVAGEMTKLARNAGADLIVMGTATDTPLAMGESINTGTLGPIVSEMLLQAPCPVQVIPPSMLPGLAVG